MCPIGHEKTECDTTSGTTRTGPSWIKITQLSHENFQ